MLLGGSAMRQEIGGNCLKEMSLQTGPFFASGSLTLRACLGYTVCGAGCSAAKWMRTTSLFVSSALNEQIKCSCGAKLVYLSSWRLTFTGEVWTLPSRPNLCWPLSFEGSAPVMI